MEHPELSFGEKRYGDFCDFSLSEVSYASGHITKLFLARSSHYCACVSRISPHELIPEAEEDKLDQNAAPLFRHKTKLGK